MLTGGRTSVWVGSADWYVTDTVTEEDTPHVLVVIINALPVLSQFLVVKPVHAPRVTGTRRLRYGLAALVC